MSKKRKSPIKPRWGSHTWPFYVLGFMVLMIPGLIVCVEWKTLLATYYIEPDEWKLTQGVIISSRLIKITGRGARRVASIEYTYSVSGKSYSSKVVRFDGESPTREEPYKPENLVSKYPVGRQVSVYYLPSRPDLCALEPQKKDHRLMSLALFCFLIGIGTLIITVRNDWILQNGYDWLRDTRQKK